MTALPIRTIMWLKVVSVLLINYC